MRKVRKRQRLKPDAAWTGESRQEDAVTAKQHIANARDSSDLKLDTRFEHPDMPGMDSHRLTGLQVVVYDFSIQLNPRMTTTTQALKQESIPSKNTGSERLLEANAKSTPGVAHKKP